MWQFRDDKVSKKAIYRVDDRGKNFGAVWTGEFRSPKKGEYFLSGNPILAYKAFADMDSVYHIAEVYKVEEVTGYVLKEKVCSR